ncbi:MAG: replicative DNA helicase [Thermoanaerobaculia bacterium]|nr:replicative DNA helicase [Thermoanaerobaculia bacterium]
MIESLPAPATLPQSEESERAVLAAALLDPRLLPAVSARLTVDDFYHQRHRLLYQAMLDLQDQQVAIDVRTLQASLEQAAKLEAAGGLAYLATLDVDLPDLGRVENYVEIVKERAVRRRLIEVCRDITRDCLDGGLDAQGALGRAEQAVLSLGEQALKRGFVPFARIADETLAIIEERPDKALIGLETGFIDLDRMTNGLHRGNLLILAGRPGMGKTSLALNIAQHVAFRLGKPVGVFSLEMGQHELALRILCSEADVAFGKLRAGHLSREQWRKVIQVLSDLRKGPLFIDDTASPTLLEVASKARRLKAEKGLELLVIDYLQLMQAGGRYENRNLEISAITRGLKQLAKEVDLPVLALSQLSRQPERRGADHRPQLSDLRESGAIEQDADLVAFVFREEFYSKDPADRGLAELIVAKHRNGETGTVPLVFLGQTTRFLNRDLRDGAPPV